MRKIDLMANLLLIHIEDIACATDILRLHVLLLDMTPSGIIPDEYHTEPQLQSDRLPEIIPFELIVRAKEYTALLQAAVLEAEIIRSVNLQVFESLDSTIPDQACTKVIKHRIRPPPEACKSNSHYVNWSRAMQYARLFCFHRNPLFGFPIPLRPVLDCMYEYQEKSAYLGHHLRYCRFCDVFGRK